MLCAAGSEKGPDGGEESIAIGVAGFVAGETGVSEPALLPHSGAETGPDALVGDADG